MFCMVNLNLVTHLWTLESFGNVHLNNRVNENQYMIWYKMHLVNPAIDFKQGSIT